MVISLYKNFSYLFPTQIICYDLIYVPAVNEV
jgi:hypothetical protein